MATAQDGRTLGFSYNAAGRRSSLTYPDGSVLRYIYDPAGRLAEITHPIAGSVTYTYNLENMPTAEHLSNGWVRTYGYTQGLLTTYSENRGQEGTTTTSLGHDLAGRIISETTNGSTATYTYDLAGQLSSWTNPHETEGEHHDAGDPGGVRTTYRYDDVGQRSALIINGVTDSIWSYDAAHELTAVVGPGGSTIYTYDAAGRRIGVRDASRTVTTTTYDARGLPTDTTKTQDATPTLSERRTYDAFDRLVRVRSELTQTALSDERDDGGVSHHDRPVQDHPGAAPELRARATSVTDGLLWDPALAIPQILELSTTTGAATDFIYGASRTFATLGDAPRPSPTTSTAPLARPRRPRPWSSPRATTPSATPLGAPGARSAPASPTAGSLAFRPGSSTCVPATTTPLSGRSPLVTPWRGSQAL